MTDRTFDEFHEPDLWDGSSTAPLEGAEPLGEEDDRGERDDWWDAFIAEFDDFIDALPHEYAGDTEWFRHAFVVLVEGSGVDWDSAAIDIVQLQLDTCALASVTREFHNQWDPSGPDAEQYLSWCDVAEHLRGAIEIGRVCERQGAYPDSVYAGEAEAAEQAIGAYALNEGHAVLRVVGQKLGENELFVSMWAARGVIESFPLPDECWGILTHPTYPALDAWGWMTDVLESPKRRQREGHE